MSFVFNLDIIHKNNYVMILMNMKNYVMILMNLNNMQLNLTGIVCCCGNHKTLIDINIKYKNYKINRHYKL